MVVPAEAIEAWMKHNMEAKRPVMARLAATLRQQTETREARLSSSREMAQGGKTLVDIDLVGDGKAILLGDDDGENCGS